VFAGNPPAASRGQGTKLATFGVCRARHRLAEKVKQQDAELERLLEQAIEREVDVRQRHAGLARALQRAAVERPMSIKPHELPVKLAVEMLRIGIAVSANPLD
jgi:hypothetical protein